MSFDVSSCPSFIKIVTDFRDKQQLAVFCNMFALFFPVLTCTHYRPSRVFNDETFPYPDDLRTIASIESNCDSVTLLFDDCYCEGDFPIAGIRGCWFYQPPTRSRKLKTAINHINNCQEVQRLWSFTVGYVKVTANSIALIIIFSRPASRNRPKLHCLTTSSCKLIQRIVCQLNKALPTTPACAVFLICSFKRVGGTRPDRHQIHQKPHTEIMHLQKVGYVLRMSFHIMICLHWQHKAGHRSMLQFRSRRALVFAIERDSTKEKAADIRTSALELADVDLTQWGMAGGISGWDSLGGIIGCHSITFHNVCA